MGDNHRIFVLFLLVEKKNKKSEKTDRIGEKRKQKIKIKTDLAQRKNK